MGVVSLAGVKSGVWTFAVGGFAALGTGVRFRTLECPLCWISWRLFRVNEFPEGVVFSLAVLMSTTMPMIDASPCLPHGRGIT